MYSFMKMVNNGIRVRLYPDDDMKVKIHQNIGNARFIWNHLLVEYLMLYQLFQQNGYNKLKCNLNTFNTLLKMLMVEYPFLKKSESSSHQQAYIDLIHAFNNYFNGKAGKTKIQIQKTQQTVFQNTDEQRKYQNQKQYHYITKTRRSILPNQQGIQTQIKK